MMILVDLLKLSISRLLMATMENTARLIDVELAHLYCMADYNRIVYYPCFSLFGIAVYVTFRIESA